MKETLVIFGSHPDTRGAFDWKRQDCDVWVFNEAVSKGEWVQWAQAVFQMHVPAIWRNPKNRNDDKHHAWLVENQYTPVYMLEHYPEIPQSVAYPLDEVVAELLSGLHKPPSAIWSNRGGYFTSSVCYAIALGIYQGYKRIELWGVELALNTEYVYQRPGALFWIGIALGRGIEVIITGHMLEAPLYGYEGDIYIEKRLFTEQLARLEAAASEYEKKYNEQTGLTLQAILAYASNNISEAILLASIKHRMEAAVMYARYIGAMDENRMYITKANAMEAESGDFRLSRTEFEQRRASANNAIRPIAMEEAAQRVRVDNAYQAISKADGYKKRLAAVDTFGAELEKQVQYLIQLARADSAANENARYMQILDEMYKAAGGERSVEVLQNDNDQQLCDPE